MAHLDAEYFSAWYADMGEVPDKDRLWSAALGLPEDVLSTSLLTGAGLDDVADLLGLGADDVLLDLACGRAGYALELLRRSGARLVGVDFAASAIAQAATNAACLGLRDRADFRVADMASTGLGPASVTAVLCVDAIQFPQDPEVVLEEILRVLVPGGEPSARSPPVMTPRYGPSRRRDAQRSSAATSCGACSRLGCGCERRPGSARVARSAHQPVSGGRGEAGVHRSRCRPLAARCRWIPSSSGSVTRVSVVAASTL